MSLFCRSSLSKPFLAKSASRAIRELYFLVVSAKDVSSAAVLALYSRTYFCAVS